MVRAIRVVELANGEEGEVAADREWEGQIWGREGNVGKLMLMREITGLWFGFGNDGETVKEGKMRLWSWEMMMRMGDQLREGTVGL